MIILRTLLIFHIESQVASDPLNARLATIRGISKGIFTYLNLHKYTLSLPLYPASGIIASIPPIAGFSLVGFDVQIPSEDSLYDLIETYTRSSLSVVSPTSFVGMFTALSLWLSTVKIQVNTGVTLVSPVGVGVISFPAMASLGLPCWSVMTGLGIAGALDQGDDESILMKSYEVLSNFIYIGLQANVIAPIPTTGVIGSAFSGLSFPIIWSFVDLYDFPPTGTSITDLLISLGLNALEDLYDLAYDENIEIETDECSVSYSDGSFISPEDTCITLTDSIVTCAVNNPNIDIEYISGEDIYDQANSFNDEMQTGGITSAYTLHEDLLGTQVIRTYDDTQTRGTITVSPIVLQFVVNRPIIKFYSNVEVVDIEIQSLVRTQK